MSKIIARDSGGGDFEHPTAGSYIARCYKLVDVGTQQQTYQGKPTGSKRKVYMWFELLEDEEGNEYRMADGLPFAVMEQLTLSTHKQATLRKYINAWRGQDLSNEEAEEFDVTVLLGQYCRLQIALDDKGERTYVNIVNLGYTKKEPKGVNPVFSWTISEPNTKAFEEFPEWLKNKIMEAEEWDGGLPPVETATPLDKVHTNPKGEVVIEDMDDSPVDLSKLKF